MKYDLFDHRVKNLPAVKRNSKNDIAGKRSWPFKSSNYNDTSIQEIFYFASSFIASK